jgi:hypothetical protein
MTRVAKFLDRKFSVTNNEVTKARKVELLKGGHVHGSKTQIYRICNISLKQDVCRCVIAMTYTRRSPSRQSLWFYRRLSRRGFAGA